MAEGADRRTGLGTDDDRSDGARREFRGTDERTWSVFEALIPIDQWTTADHDTFRAGYGIGWLCFETKDEKRNIRMYPRNWRKLPESALIRLWDRSRDATGYDYRELPAG